MRPFFSIVVYLTWFLDFRGGGSEMNAVNAPCYGREEREEKNSKVYAQRGDVEGDGLFRVDAWALVFVGGR